MPHHSKTYRIIALLAALILLILPIAMKAASANVGSIVARSYSGRIVVELGSGDVWYVNPDDLSRVYLGKAEEALSVLLSLGLGISNKDFKKIPLEGEKKLGNKKILNRLTGRIVIKVQDKRKVYYVHPVTRKAISLAAEDDMERLIKNSARLRKQRLEKIPLSKYNPLLEETIDKDSDEDGLSDFDEIQLKTSPFKAEPARTAPTSTTPYFPTAPSGLSTTTSTSTVPLANLPQTPFGLPSAVPSSTPVPTQTPAPASASTTTQGQTQPQSSPTSTTPTPLDTAPPVISGIQTSNITETSAAISWTTNEASIGEVRYSTLPGASSISTNWVRESQSTTNHSVNIFGLTPGTTYYFTVVSKDSSLNAATSTEKLFTTLTPPPPASIWSISSLNQQGYDPVLVWNGSGYGAVWATVNDDFRGEVYFAKLDANGNIISGPIVVSNGAGLAGLPSLAWNGSEYVIVWSDRKSDGTWGKLHFIRLNSNGGRIAGDIKIGSPGIGHDFWSQIIWTGSGYGIFWVTSAYTSNYEVYFMKLTSTGEKITNDTRISYNGAGNTTGLSVAWTGSEYGVVWQFPVASNADAYFQRVSANGDRSGEPLKLTSTSQMEPYPTIGWSGSLYGVIWKERGEKNGFMVSQMKFAQISSSGALLNAPFYVEGIEKAYQSLNLVWSGSEYGALWSDQRENGTLLYFTKLNSGGTKTITDTRITDINTVSWDSFLIFNGDRFAAIWEMGGGTSTLYFAAGR